MAHYGMAIDLTRCFGCHACEVACKVANNNPAELDYNRVYTVAGTGQTDPVTYDTASGIYPNCTLTFLPMQCQHCENAPCVEACPTGATQKDPETGVVWVDEQQCIGCEACMTACPYEGVRTHVSSEPSWYLDVVVGEADAPSHPGNTRYPPACSSARAAPASGATSTIPNPRCPSSWPPARAYA